MSYINYINYMSYMSWTHCLKNEYSKNLYIKEIFWFVLNRSNRFAIISSIQRERVDSFLLVLNNSNESMNWIVWFIFMSKNTNRRFWLFDSLFFNFWNKIVTLFFFSIFFVLEKFYLSCSMFFIKFQYRVNLYSRVSQKSFVIMIICFRCARNQKKMSFFFCSKNAQNIFVLIKNANLRCLKSIFSTSTKLWRNSKKTN